MKFPRLSHDPGMLIEFFEEGLTVLGAVCERSWHDRLDLVAEGRAASLWNTAGGFVEKQLRFVPPDAMGGRDAARRNLASRAGGASDIRSATATVLRRGRKNLARAIFRRSTVAARRPVSAHLAFFRAVAGALRDSGDRPAVVVAPSDAQLRGRPARRFAGRKTGFRGRQPAPGPKPLLARARTGPVAGAD